MLVSEMPVGHKQFTEIAREINREKTRILVLDEPTAVLTETEAEVLLKALRNLAAQGIAIIFISHRLHEVVAVADRIVVLRDGLLVKDTPAAGVHGARHRLLDGRPRRGRRAGRAGRRQAPRRETALAWSTSGWTCPARPSAT